jgi:protein-tyrosine kinase
LRFSATPPEQPLQADFPSSRLFPPRSMNRTQPWDTAAAADKGIFGFNSRDMRSRPFNLLRTRLLKLSRANDWRLFGVASATPKVGKSFISANLAAALSRTPDLDVYLMDFDLRRSSVASNFGIEEGPGLQQFLSGEVAALDGIAVRPEGENLTILPSFRTATHSSELLSGKPMDRLVHAMRQLSDRAVFICDLPPVFANDDASIVASKLDAYILVVEEGRTTKKQVRDSINILAPAICAGTVLNRYHGGLISDDYGYGYGHSANYGDYYG